MVAHGAHAVTEDDSGTTGIGTVVDHCDPVYPASVKSPLLIDVGSEDGEAVLTLNHVFQVCSTEALALLMVLVVVLPVDAHGPHRSSKLELDEDGVELEGKVE